MFRLEATTGILWGCINRSYGSFRDTNYLYLDSYLMSAGKTTLGGLPVNAPDTIDIRMRTFKFPCCFMVRTVH